MVEDALEKMASEGGTQEQQITGEADDFSKKTFTISDETIA